MSCGANEFVGAIESIAVKVAELAIITLSYESSTVAPIAT